MLKFQATADDVQHWRHEVWVQLTKQVGAGRPKSIGCTINILDEMIEDLVGEVIPAGGRVVFVDGSEYSRHIHLVVTNSDDGCIFVETEPLRLARMEIPYDPPKFGPYDNPGELL